MDVSCAPRMYRQTSRCSSSVAPAAELYIALRGSQQLGNVFCAASSRGAGAGRASVVKTNAVASPEIVQPKEGPIILDGQVLHSIEPHRLEIVQSMEKDGWVERELTKMLKPVEKSWQPADYLPDGADPDFIDKVCIFFSVYCRYWRSYSSKMCRHRSLMACITCCTPCYLHSYQAECLRLQHDSVLALLCTSAPVILLSCVFVLH